MGDQTTVTPRHKLFAVLMMLLFATPNVYHVIVAAENFPFTCAPMFGHYIDKETPFYSFKFIGEFSDTEKVLTPQLGRISELSSQRYFFSKVYGSCEDISPFGNHPGDTPRQFEERLSRYFEQYLSVLARTMHTDLSDLKRLRLEVWHYDANDQVDVKHVVGHYTVSTGKFTHEWHHP